MAKQEYDEGMARAFDPEQPEGGPVREKSELVQYIINNREEYIRYFVVSNDLGAEIEGRRQSQVIRQLAVDSLAIKFGDGIRIPNFNKQVNERLGILRSVLFWLPERDYVNGDYGNRQTGIRIRKDGVERRTNAQIDEWAQRAQGVRNAFIDDTTFLTDAFFERRNLFYSGLYANFFHKRFSSLAALQDLLTSSDRAEERDYYMPLLIDLAVDMTEVRTGMRETNLSGIHRKWVTFIEERGVPEPVAIQFLERNPKYLDWLNFSIGVAQRYLQQEGVDISFGNLSIEEKVRTFLPDLSNIPSDLREAVQAYGLRELQSTIDGLRTKLVEIVPKDGSTTIDFSRERAGNGKKRGFTNGANDYFASDDGENGQEEERQIYQVARIVKTDKDRIARMLSEDELEKYIQRKAQEIAPDDPRMVVDVRNMISYTIGNPYDFGTKPVISDKVKIKGKKHQVRRLDPRKMVTGPSLLHPLSSHMRVSYVVMEESGKKTVAIRNVTNHEDYEREIRL